jgi:hypothetical protein
MECINRLEILPVPILATICGFLPSRDLLKPLVVFEKEKSDEINSSDEFWRIIFISKYGFMFKQIELSHMHGFKSWYDVYTRYLFEQNNSTSKVIGPIFGKISEYNGSRGKITIGDTSHNFKSKGVYDWKDSSVHAVMDRRTNKVLFVHPYVTYTFDYCMQCSKIRYVTNRTVRRVRKWRERQNRMSRNS